MINYYELKDKSAYLPDKLKFIDPYDSSIYITSKEKIDEFIRRINDNRIKNKYPVMNEQEAYHLIIENFVATAPKDIVDKYFQKHSTLPQMNQAISFSRALVYEILHDNRVSTIQKKNRAKLCLACPFHQRPTAVPTNTFQNLINRIPLGESTQYDEERFLGQCTLCGCPLKGKVKFQLMSILTGLVPDQLDRAVRTLGSRVFSACWIFNEALRDNQTRQLLSTKLRYGRANGEQIMNGYLQSQNLKDRNNGEKN